MQARASKPRRLHPELSRLPKAPSLRSIRFKRTNPGTVSHLAFAPPSTSVLDPTHPLARAYPRPRQLLRVVPRYHCSLFEAHVFPHAVLRRFAVPQLMVQLKSKAASDELAMLISGSRKDLSSQTNVATTKQSKSHSDSVRAGTGAAAAAAARAGHVGDHRRAAHTVPMSLMVVTPRKALHKAGVVRTRIKRRLKEALSLVAIRGARPREDDDGLKSKYEDKDGRIAFRTLEGLQRDDIEASGILQGWTYVIRPSLEVYRCPWPSLLQHLQEALSHTRTLAMELEAKWTEERRQSEQRGTNTRDARKRPRRNASLNPNSNVPKQTNSSPAQRQGGTKQH